ncbi:zinc finger MYND domain-containing protein [Sporobolomyces salmoneus]|uniref:zinc finger MYND domain-containing protein n=1 Tax=Sporobolomyces salmoneus TaxID=183962 RepID=UPI00316E3031
MDRATTVLSPKRSPRVFYCGTDHQKENWGSHKLECKRLAAERASSSESQDPLFSNFTWTSYLSSSHRKPLDPYNRPPPQMTIHPFAQLGDHDTAARLRDPWYPAEEFKKNKMKAYEKLISAFSLWQDDCVMWKGVKRGLYDRKDPYPEFEKFLKWAKPHLPNWWTVSDSTACLARARSSKSPNVYDALEKDGFNTRFGSPTAAMAMRMWVDGFVDVTVGK